MTALRQRMIEDMRLRNLSPHTIEAYVHAVKQFARHFGQSPEQLSAEQARQYLLHLVQDQKASWSRYNLARCGLQFLYRVTLSRDKWFKKLPCARVPKKLPTVLSPDEVRRLLDVVAHHPRNKALLITSTARDCGSPIRIDASCRSSRARCTAELGGEEKARVGCRGIGTAGAG
jgi:integrase/recombinase XerD